MSERIKVAHVWSEFHPGLFADPHEYLLDSKEWDSVSFASDLIRKDNPVPDKLFAYSTKSLAERNRQSIFGKIVAKLQAPFYWRAYNRWLQAQPAFQGTSIVHAHFGQMAVRLLPLLKSSNLPLIISFYGVDGSRLLKEKKWVEGYKRIFPYTKAAIVLCEEVKHRLMAIGLPEDRIRVWRIPIELDTYQYQPRVPSTQVRFIIAARFVEKKGYPYVLEAFDKMVKEGKNVKLTMIGYGDERYKVEEDIKQRQLEAHTRLLDTKVQGNFPAFYYKELLQHDIFVLPSTTAKKGDDEGGPALTLVAAQAAGLPVICTPFPGAEMSVVENETGIFCAFNDANSLYKKMVYLYDHPEQWNRLGHSASSFVHKAFSMKPQMEEVLAIYREAVKK